MTEYFDGLTQEDIDKNNLNKEKKRYFKKLFLFFLFSSFSFTCLGIFGLSDLLNYSKNTIVFILLFSFSILGLSIYCKNASDQTKIYNY